MSIHPPLATKRGNTLIVIAVTRISTEHQDERSLDDQLSKLKEFVESSFNGSIEWVVLSGRASGELLDRDQLVELERRIATDTVDLVISEDLGRICRRIHAHLLCEHCEDHETRLIAINDHVDTGKKDWRLHSYFAVMRHETYNRDTAERIQRTHRNRFKDGGVVQCFPYGYIKPPICKSDAEVSKDPAAELIYDEWFRKLEDGASYAEVADRLNEQGIPTGPYCREESWTGPMVRRVTFNPILKGIRVRNRVKSKRINKTGRRKSVKADPSELLERHCPHLAFVDPERYDRVIRMLEARNAKYARKGANGVDPRKNTPKKRTKWPGQHIVCGVCGRPMFYGGNGRRNRLTCQGAMDYRCWNGVSFDSTVGARKLAKAIVEALEQVPDFDEELLSQLQDEMEAQASGRQQRLQRFDQRARTLERERENIIKAIRQTGMQDVFVEELRRIEFELGELAADRYREEQLVGSDLELPTIDTIKTKVREVFADLAVESPEFQRAVKRLLPTIEASPFHLIDGGNPILRARVELDLGCLLPDALRGRLSLPRHDVWVDLFDQVPKRIRLRETIVELRRTKTQRQVAETLQIPVATVEAAMALQRKMDAEGVSDPYVQIREPDELSTKFCRHKHPRYRFEPLAGYRELNSPDR